MIISHKHRYIFLHCRKAAGSSIAVSLARDLGPDDIMLSGILEALQEGIDPPRALRTAAADGLRHLGGSDRLKWRLRLAGLQGQTWRARAMQKLAKSHYCGILGEDVPEHAHATSIAQAYGEEWTAYRKFCVVRNPWTKTVSDYFWRTKSASPPPSFAEFVQALEVGDPLGGIVRHRYHDNWPLYTIDDKVVADEVVRFENLLPDLTRVCAAFGIPFDGWLPRSKGGHRPKTGFGSDPYSFYTPEIRDTVGRLYEREISTFGYTFDGP